MHRQCRTSVREIRSFKRHLGKTRKYPMVLFFLRACWNRRSKIALPGGRARTKDPPLARSKYPRIQSLWPAACKPRTVPGTIRFAGRLRYILSPPRTDSTHRSPVTCHHQ